MNAVTCLSQRIEGLLVLQVISCFIGVFLVTNISANESIEDEVEGVLINRTVTLVGYNFYRELGDYRRANDIRTSDNLIIYERPSARWGSLIWVVSGSDEVYRQFLGPRLSVIPEIAKQASPQIDARLARAKLNRLLSDKFDIGNEEF